MTVPFPVESLQENFPGEKIKSKTISQKVLLLCLPGPALFQVNLLIQSPGSMFFCLRQNILLQNYNSTVKIQSQIQPVFDLPIWTVSCNQSQEKKTPPPVREGGQETKELLGGQKGLRMRDSSFHDGGGRRYQFIVGQPCVARVNNGRCCLEGDLPNACITACKSVIEGEGSHSVCRTHRYKLGIVSNPFETTRNTFIQIDPDRFCIAFVIDRYRNRTGLFVICRLRSRYLCYRYIMGLDRDGLRC
jgi:hypothetical protein